MSSLGSQAPGHKTVPGLGRVSESIGSAVKNRIFMGPESNQIRAQAVRDSRDALRDDQLNVCRRPSCHLISMAYFIFIFISVTFFVHDDRAFFIATQQPLTPEIHAHVCMFVVCVCVVGGWVSVFLYLRTWSIFRIVYSLLWTDSFPIGLLCCWYLLCRN